MARTRPYFRRSLHPFPDAWSGGPGLLCSIVRFGLWAGALVEGGDQPGGSESRTALLALLTPEAPYSVLPFFLQNTSHILTDRSTPAIWQGQPVPRWRGVSCQIGTIQLVLSNEVRGAVDVPFSLQVLLPEADPPGPRPDCLHLGEQFLRHYDLHVLLDYSAIRYVPAAGSGRRQLDSTVRCGSLQMF